MFFIIWAPRALLAGCQHDPYAVNDVEMSSFPNSYVALTPIPHCTVEW